MTDKLTHLRKASIRQIIGHLDDDEMQRLEGALISIIGLRQSVLPIAAIK
jgi:mRNA interferase MazF